MGEAGNRSRPRIKNDTLANSAGMRHLDLKISSAPPPLSALPSFALKKDCSQRRQAQVQ